MPKLYKIQLSDTDGNVFYSHNSYDIVFDDDGNPIKDKIDTIKHPVLIEDFDNFDPTRLNIKTGGYVPVYTNKDIITPEGQAAAESFSGFIQRINEDSYTLLITIENKGNKESYKYGRSYTSGAWKSWTKYVTQKELEAHTKNEDIHVTKADKNKLDAVEANANNYTHPNSGVAAGSYVQVNVNQQGHVTSGTTAPLPVTSGGTGGTTAAAARTNLDVPSKGEVLTKTNTTAYTPAENYHPATKGYVDSAIISGGIAPYEQDPKMNGEAAAGSSANFSKGDHVHPVDTSRAPLNHADSSTSYGAATTSQYGHVKVTANNGLNISSGTLSMNAASTTAKGGVQLNNTTSSTSTTLAATANSVKQTYDYADTKAPKSHAATDTSYGAASTTNYGHVKVNTGGGLSVSNGALSMASGSTTTVGGVQLNNTTSSTSTTLAATANAVKLANDNANTKAPKSHAASDTSYGVGSTTNYGHVKVNSANGLSISSGTVSLGSASSSSSGAMSSTDFNKLSNYPTNPSVKAPVTITGSWLAIDPSVYGLADGESVLLRNTTTTATSNGLGVTGYSTGFLQRYSASYYKCIISLNYSTAANGYNLYVSRYYNNSWTGIKKLANEDDIEGRAPKSHASTDSSYGLGSTTQYGHLKVGSGLSVLSGTVSLSSTANAASVGGYKVSKNATSGTIPLMEVGDFTPSFGTSTYSDRSGRYVKIGGLVYVNLSMAISRYDGSTNSISGFPFTPQYSYQMLQVEIRGDLSATIGHDVSNLFCRASGGFGVQRAGGGVNAINLNWFRSTTTEPVTIRVSGVYYTTQASSNI